jgi:hypothetical protein
MYSILYYNVVYKKQKTWFLYPVRDVILYGEYTPYPEGYELDVVYNICHRYFKNCDKLGGKYSKLLRQALWKIITGISLLVENNPQPLLAYWKIFAKLCNKTWTNSEVPRITPYNFA